MKRKALTANKSKRPSGISFKDQDYTVTALYITGFAALAIASVALGISIGGIGGIALLLGGIIFPALILGTIMYGMYLRYSWPHNLFTVLGLLGLAGGLGFGIFGAAALGAVAWVPLAIAGVLSVVTAILVESN